MLVAAFTLGCGLLWLRSQPERVGRLWLVTGLMDDVPRDCSRSAGMPRCLDSASAHVPRRRRAWIDDAAACRGDGRRVVWRERLASTRPDPFAPWIMVAEFFNPAVGDVYRLGGRTYYEDFLPTDPRAGADGRRPARPERRAARGERTSSRPATSRSPATSSPAVQAASSRSSAWSAGRGSQGARRARRPEPDAGRSHCRGLLAPLPARPVFGARSGAGTAAWIAGIVALSALVRAVISVDAISPWVLPDELVYSDLARSIAAGGRPAVRGVPVFGWGEVYPTLVAPVWALVDDRYVAYHAALAVGAVLMSLAAVPAYLLARLFVSRTPSLLVAALTVLVPSLSYTGALLTENAFYPLFVLALYAICRAVRRPTAGAQAFALVALGLVVFTRIQGAALLARVRRRDPRLRGDGLSAPCSRHLRRFWPTAAVAVPVALAPLAASVARGEGPFGWLGGALGHVRRPSALRGPRSGSSSSAAGLVLYVAVVPAVATAVVAAPGCRGGPPSP